MGRFGSVGQALASLGGQPGMKAAERERLKPAPETPREIGERRKRAEEARAKAFKRRKPLDVTLPPDAPQKRSERRKLIKQLARQAKGGGGKS